MSDSQNKDSKTEEPTEKKLRDAVERGNVPVSREVSTFASVIAMLIIVAFVAKDSFRSIGLTITGLFGDLGAWPLQNGPDAVSLFRLLAWTIFEHLIPALLILAGSGLFAAVVQNAPRIVFDRIQPDLQRISVLNGWRRIAGTRGQTEFVKNIFKLMSICIVFAIVLQAQLGNLVTTMVDTDALPDLLLMLTMRLLSAVCIVTLLLLAADLLWSRIHWRKDLRMSRQDVKDEMKQSEGDPLMKARIRSAALDRIRKSMIAAVPRATLVIANPTHYAIALRYVREEGGAPVVLAKGKDLVAMKIREVAEQHSIPVVEDKPLARSMYDSVEVDRAIPREFYKALAEIIHLLHAKSARGASGK